MKNIDNNLTASFKVTENDEKFEELIDPQRKLINELKINNTKVVEKITELLNQINILETHKSELKTQNTELKIYQIKSKNKKNKYTKNSEY